MTNNTEFMDGYGYAETVSVENDELKVVIALKDASSEIDTDQFMAIAREAFDKASKRQTLSEKYEKRLERMKKLRLVALKGG